MENTEGVTPALTEVVRPDDSEKAATPQELPAGQTLLSSDTTLSNSQDNNNGGKDEILKKDKEKELSAAAGVKEGLSPSGQTTTIAPTSAATATYVPPVKKFSAVNINKKFLEKSGSASNTGASHSSISSGSRHIGVIARPTPQTTNSHSRLVTAKLTGVPSLSPSPGTGWSRPQSATPPAPSPSNQNPPIALNATNAAQGLNGKPSPALGLGSLSQKADGFASMGKSAWRNVNSIGPNISSQREFPTAAEAAQSELLKAADLKITQEAYVAQEQAQEHAISESADTFRGVHLNPNAHHWDEEDDNDFMGGVIEFGDGTQYTIQVNDGVSLPNGTSVEQSDAPLSKLDRFADDFDRSWPRARNEYPPLSGSQDDRRSQTRQETSSDTSSSPVSVRDLSQARVLFNERLNRMEPASNRAGPHPPHQAVQAADARGRPPDRQDGPPFGSRSRVLLLQKPHHVPPHEHGEDSQLSQRPSPTGDNWRDEARESGGNIFRASDASRDAQRGGRAWGTARGDLSSIEDVDGHYRPGVSREPSASRNSVNGTSSVASSISNKEFTKPPTLGKGFNHGSEVFRQSQAARDMDRQVPPHLHKGPPVAWKTPAKVDKLPSPSSQFPTLPAANAAVAAVTSRAGSNTATQRSLEMPFEKTEPIVEIAQHMPSLPENVDEIQKAVLQDSAERAKRRRQQEEEERQKAQERARKKAAELEARLAAQANKKQEVKIEASVVVATEVELVQIKPSEEEVVHIIEEAVNNTEPSRSATSDRSKGFVPHQSQGERRRPSVSSAAPQRPSTISERADTWRSKSARQPAQPHTTPPEPVEKNNVAFIPAVPTFDVQVDGEVEIVDFSDMGRFVGEREEESKSLSMSEVVRVAPGRPVASDFFDDNVKPKPDPWRRDTASASEAISSGSGLSLSLPLTDGPPVPQHPSLEPPASENISSPVVDVHAPFFPTSPRFPKTPMQCYREAPLSALDDTMSRIKGALDGMHAGKIGLDDKDNDSTSVMTDQDPVSHRQVRPPVEKWLPPAKRTASTHHLALSRVNLFAVSIPDLPRSPPPNVDRHVILLPHSGKDSRRPLVQSKKHAFILRGTTNFVRWDILSFDPPVEGMTKKSLSVNDVLFRKPSGMYKKDFKYVVSMPKSSSVRPLLPNPLVSNTPAIRVHLATPTSGKAYSSTFGRSGASDQGNWRTRKDGNSPPLPPIPIRPPTAELNITSRSPPPDPTSLRELHEMDSIPETVPSQVPQSSAILGKPRAPQKMPDGTNVAFYRDTRESLESSTVARKVSFIVSSELDIDDAVPAAFELKVEETAVPPTDISSSTVSSDAVKAHSHQDSKASDDESLQSRRLEESIEALLSQPTTPPSQHVPLTLWHKSPSRVPDPEVLKAVWSQASDKDTTPSVNSLKAITDDLIAVPFSLHEVKSDDGSTPPPSGSVAPVPRMSASEVTKAFQMVPPTPSNATTSTTSRPSHFTPSMSSPLSATKPLKPAIAGLPPPPTNGAVRPHYVGYPAPMISHTPSPPTIMYPHHMGANGLQTSPAGSPYGQPVWMPMHPHAQQQTQQMMIPQQSSPYNPSLMPYHPPNAAQNGTYPSPAARATGQGSMPSYPGAAPSQMMVSPVMGHAAPVHPHMIYGASPVLLPVAPPGVPPTHGYPGAIGMGRGSLPPRNAMDSRSAQNHIQPGNPNPRFPPVHNPTYNHAAPQHFVRPTW